MLLEIFHCERQEGERRARERRPESTFHVGDEGIMLFSFLVISLFIRFRFGPRRLRCFFLNWIFMVGLGFFFWFTFIRKYID